MFPSAAAAAQSLGSSTWIDMKMKLQVASMNVDYTYDVRALNVQKYNASTELRHAPYDGASWRARTQCMYIH
jgi:hypothetical protein